MLFWNLVAEDAPVPPSRDGRFGLQRGRRMTCSGAVANLAGHPRMVGAYPELSDVRVAQGTLLPTGILPLVAGHLIHGCGPVVARVSKHLRDQKTPSHEAGGA